MKRKLAEEICHVRVGRDCTEIMCAEFVKFEKDLVNGERFADLRVKSSVG